MDADKRQGPFYLRPSVFICGSIRNFQEIAAVIDIAKGADVFQVGLMTE
jgi:hypothetical protein